MTDPRQIYIMNTKRIALAVTAALTLAAMAQTVACVNRVEPCAEFDTFAEIYAASCPAVDAWATECATNLDLMPPEARQDFDWCVDCYRDLNDDPSMDCSDAPLGAGCPTFLNDTLDASCNWPTPVL